jgi:hypothetical protein
VLGGSVWIIVKKFNDCGVKPVGELQNAGIQLAYFLCVKPFLL